MKILLVLNEEIFGSHEDYYLTLPELVRRGELDDYQIYSFLARMRDGLRCDQIMQEILGLAVKYEPDAILWLHTKDLSMGEHDIERFEALPARPIMGYWEGDVYKKPYNPIPRNVWRLVRKCDVSFWQGRWHLMDDLKKAGCKDCRYIPDSTYEQRFGQMRQCQIEYDVVMVGNYISSRIPWKTFPGTFMRKKLAEYFYKKLGKRFAVYGGGWKGPYARGVVPLHEQNAANQKGRIAVGVNSSFVDYYFSNRLPICMSGGVPIVHNYQKGLDEVFLGCRSPYFFRTIEEAWDISQRLLEKSQKELDQIGIESREYALKKLSKINILSYMIAVLGDHKDAQKGNHSLFIRLNPWINKATLL